jgi:hypothetical protein
MDLLEMSRVLIGVWGGDMVAGDYMDSQGVMQAATEGLRFGLPVTTKGAISIELARLVGINGSVNKHRGERDGSGG